MKSMVGVVFAVIFLACGMVNSNASALATSPLPPELPASLVLITGYQMSGGLPDFVQIYNDSSDIISLTGWRLELTVNNQSVEMTLPVSLGSWLLPHQYAVVAQTGKVQGADSEFSVPDDLGALMAEKLRLVPPGGYQPYVAKGDFTDKIRYALSQTAAGNYTASSKFEANLGTPLYGGGLYEPPEATSLRAVEILANARDCGPLEQAADCREYVKLYNASDKPADASQYRLRLGYGNENLGIANEVQLSGTIAPHSYFSVTTRDDDKPLDITASAGNVWLEDTQGLKTYSKTVVTYKDIGDRKGFPWAKHTDGTWDWSVANPTGPNDFRVPSPAPVVSSTTPCKAGQYRSSETHRCRKIATTSKLTACKPGQYRSAETNRCRSLATATSSLKPCTPGQTRNPATNRCHANATATKQLTPCKAGQERNPETHRCRNAGGAVLGDAAYAVEPIKQTGTAFVGWWALGGIGILAAGYGVWEWRQEISATVVKAGEFFRARK